MGFRPLSVTELAGIAASLRKSDRAATPVVKASEEVAQVAPVETQVETAPAPAEEAPAVSTATKSGFKKKNS